MLGAAQELLGTRGLVAHFMNVTVKPTAPLVTTESESITGMPLELRGAPLLEER